MRAAVFSSRCGLRLLRLGLLIWQIEALRWGDNDSEAIPAPSGEEKGSMRLMTLRKAHGLLAELQRSLELSALEYEATAPTTANVGSAANFEGTMAAKLLAIVVAAAVVIVFCRVSPEEKENAAFQNAKEGQWLEVSLGAFIFFLCLVPPLNRGLQFIAVEAPPVWLSPLTLWQYFKVQWCRYVLLWASSLGLCCLPACVGTLSLRPLRRGLIGFTVVFSLAALAQAVAAFAAVKSLHVEDSLVALIFGMLLSCVWTVPDDWRIALRSEFYIRLGIVLLGATLPLKLLAAVGPIALLQAAIISVLTFVTIFGVSTAVLQQNEKLSAMLAAAGSVCGVAAAVAVGSALRADKKHVAVASSVCILVASGMVFVLPMLATYLQLTPGVAGAWIGSSSFGDGTGMAAAKAVRADGDTAIQAFTIVKVAGRDIWIGVWCLALSAYSVAAKWDQPEEEAQPAVAQVDKGAADTEMSRAPALEGGKSTEKEATAEEADEDEEAGGTGLSLICCASTCCAASTDDASSKLPAAAGAEGAGGGTPEAAAREVDEEVAPSWNPKPKAVQAPAATDSKQPASSLASIWECFPKFVLGFFGMCILAYVASGFGVAMDERIPGLKGLRSWLFAYAFIAIGLTTNLRELMSNGAGPSLTAFLCGVAVNLPVGYFLSAVAFNKHWAAL
eukprot:TRINITY_DN34402_c0_g1_i1.p1 TRINITY_DN34402_c0_g1~~TRINITY_DN34402_c0_g1_i1.p1  ORF type:complete len:673 (+),score=118.93 TRINITY_DN34402_c0_g1_i1:211-2229(+)